MDYAQFRRMTPRFLACTTGRMVLPRPELGKVLVKMLLGFVTLSSLAYGAP